MASRVAVAIERDAAIQRINNTLARLAEEAGHEYAPLPTQGRDAEVVTKNQLVHLANTLDTLFNEGVIAEPVEDGDRDTEDADIPPADDRDEDDSDYQAMTKGQLLNIASAGGLELSERLSKQAMIDELIAYGKKSNKEKS